MPDPAQDDVFEQWLAELAASGDEEPEGEAQDQEVLQRLPEGTPAEFRRLAKAVLEAWTDPARRQALREAPESYLREQGVSLPPGSQLEVVRPEDVRLPGPTRIAIPLPDAGEGAMSHQEAEDALMETEWVWLLGAPWLDEAAEAQAAPRKEPASVRGPREDRAWRWRLPLPAPAMAAAALGALALAFGLSQLSGSDGGGMTGTAGDGVAIGSPWLWLLVAGALLGLGVWAWRSGR